MRHIYIKHTIHDVIQHIYREMLKAYYLSGSSLKGTKPSTKFTTQVYIQFGIDTRRAPHLEMSPKLFILATIAFFSSDQAHCALAVCDCERQTPSTGLRHPSFGGRCRKAMLGVCMKSDCRRLIYTACKYPPKWLQRCLVVTRLVPRETSAVSAHVLCIPYNHTTDYSVTLFEVTYVQGACVPSSWL